MRQILLDHARRRLAQKRGGGSIPAAVVDTVAADDGEANAAEKAKAFLYAELHPEGP